jgi:CMP-N-acetylneuraminic acid synthetase
LIGRRVAGLVTSTADSIDIDTPLDLALAELLLGQRVLGV